VCSNNTTYNTLIRAWHYNQNALIMVWHYSHIQQKKQSITLSKLTKVYARKHLSAIFGLRLRAQFCSCVIHVLRQSESSIWLDNTKHINRNTVVLSLFRGLCSIKRLSYGAMAITNRQMNDV